MKNIIALALVSSAVPLFAVTVGDQDISVEFYTPRTVRVLKTPAGATFSKPFETVNAKPGAVSVKFEGSETATWSSDALVVKLDKKTRLVSFWTPLGERIFGEKENAYFHHVEYGACKAMRVNQCFESAKDEGLYGLGDLENGRLNQRGEKNTLTPRNVGNGIPYVASNRGWALWWDNTSPTQFQDRPGDLFYFESEMGEGVDYYFLWGGSGDGCVVEMRELTGDVPMFPRWAYGFWQSKERYKTPQETVAVLESYRKNRIPLDGIVQDWQYWGGNYLWNAMEFTGEDWRDGDWMIRRAHELNAKMIITIWQSFGPHTKAYRELDPQGLLFPFETWPPSGLSHIWPPRKDYPSGVKLCDNFSPIVRDVYWKNLKRLWNAGMDGWWMDSTDPDHFAKPGDMEHMTSLGVPYRAVRNAYPVSATMGVYERQRAETDKKRVFILTRGAGAGQQRFATSVWSGDIASNWDMLRKQVPGGLNYTVTGNPQFNCDIGGFFAGRYGHGEKGVNNVNYRELYARWMQLGALLPMMRSHGTEVPREVYLYGKPGEEVYDALVGAIKLRYRLMPYIYSLAGHVTKDRASVMRPLWFDYAADPKTRDEAYEYMFGTEILAAPVLKALYTTEDNKPVGEYEGWNKKAEGGEKVVSAGVDLNKAFAGERKWSAYLPKGSDWWCFASEKKLAGGQTVEFPVTLRSVPIFVKAGGILPLGPDVQFNGEKDWSSLDVNVYPGAYGAYAFYEDAFDSYDYEKGAWTEIPMKWDDAAKTLTIGARVGSYPEMPKNRTFTVKAVGLGTRTVKYSGEEVKVQF